MFVLIAKIRRPWTEGILRQCKIAHFLKTANYWNSSVQSTVISKVLFRSVYNSKQGVS